MQDVPNPEDLTYSELEELFIPLIEQFAGWNIGGHVDRDDLRQEMRLTLFKAQRSFKAGKMRPGQKRPASFSWFVWRAMRNAVSRIDAECNRRCSKVPARSRLSIEATGIDIGRPDIESLACIDILTGLSADAVFIARMALAGSTTKKSWRKAGLTERRIREAMAELGEVLHDGAR